jgi:hypothetical protein
MRLSPIPASASIAAPLAPRPQAPANRALPAEAPATARVAPDLRWREVEAQQGLEQAAEREKVMIIAFALAIVGAIVLGSIEVSAHVHAHAHR